MDYLQLALRNTLRNGRRSAVTLLAVAFGFMSINLFSGYIHNVYAGLAAQAIRGERLGHLTVMKAGARALGKLEPQKYLIHGAELARLAALVRADPGVELATPKLAASGLVSNGSVSTIFIGEGMVPQDAITLRGDFRRDRGGLLDPARPDAGLAGADLVRMLKLAPGGYATLLVSTVAGQTNALDLELLAPFNTGNANTNDKQLLLPLAYTQRLLATDGADRLVVLLKDGDTLAAAQARLQANLAAAGFEVELFNWQELSDFYKQVRKLFDMIFAFIFAIVLVVVLMGIVNTMTMSVVERTREIGTLRAMGMRRRQVAWLFCVEGGLLVLLGSVAGVLLTGAVALLVNGFGIAYVPPGGSDSVRLLVDFVPGMMALALLLLSVVATAAALIPARRATRMSVVDALAHV